MPDDNLTFWVRELGPCFDCDQTAEMFGKVASDPSVLLELDRSKGGKLYPAFQFNPSGCPYPEIARIMAIFHGAVESSYTVAAWFISPQDHLAGNTPAAWMRAGRDPEILCEAARRAAARLVR
jgi:hypothetical protein